MKKSQVSIIAQCSIVLCALLLGGSSTRVDAQGPNTGHPPYLHAIRNLREARTKLDYPFKEPLHQQIAAAAKQEIDEAIGDLKQASHLDDKAIGNVPPPNYNLPENGTFHNVSDLLGQARKDASGPESDPAAKAHRDYALQHIDAAIATVHRAL